MIRYQCDKCGVSMSANDSRRFIVRMEMYAAAGHVDLNADGDDRPKQGMAEVLKHLADADPDEVEDRTYRAMRFDVCDRCRHDLLRNPLG